MGARLVGVRVRQREEGKECRNASIQRPEAPVHENEDADAKDPDPQNGRKTGGDEPFAEEVLAPSREQIEERRI